MKTFFNLLLVAILISSTAVAAEKTTNNKATEKAKTTKSVTKKPEVKKTDKKTEAKKPAEKAEPKEVPKPKPLKLNSFANVFAEKGVSKCLPRAQQVTQFLITGAESGGYIYPLNKDANKQLVSTSLEVVPPGKASVYASASFAPVGEGCSAVYEAVSWVDKSCDVAASSLYPGVKSAGVIKSQIKVLNLNANAQVFLLPSKDGCIMIKKEMVLEN